MSEVVMLQALLEMWTVVAWGTVSIAIIAMAICVGVDWWRERSERRPR